MYTAPMSHPHRDQWATETAPAPAAAVELGPGHQPQSDQCPYLARPAADSATFDTLEQRGLISRIKYCPQPEPEPSAPSIITIVF